MRRGWKPYYRWEKSYHIRRVCGPYKVKIKEQKKQTKLESESLKSTRTGVSEGKIVKYPSCEKPNDKMFTKTFSIKYDGTLSIQAKAILNTFQNKYIYYAIDDILYFCDSHLDEREKLKTILYSTMLSLQNDFSINFFDIWIDSIYYNDIKVNNRFLKSNTENKPQFTQINLTLSYLVRSPAKKIESLW